MYRKKKIIFDSFDLDFYESFVDYLSSAIFKEEGEKLCDGRMNYLNINGFYNFGTKYLLKVPFINNNLNSLLNGSQKMSKSRNNSIMIKSTEDETNKLFKSAKTDSERFIEYDPVNRPEVTISYNRSECL